ncbi:MAG: ABC transporter permease, partial [Verrucomicrobiota bacterium]|nr:ABC transporter permease [Verrucomicrobiota bacterium]
KLITKVYFPRILVPLASTVAVLVDFIVSLIVLIILMLYYGVSPGLEILTLPLWLLLTVLLGTGVSLWLSAINVKYRDFMYAMPFLIQLWMYATPVVYASSLIPEKWRWIFALNPMVGIIEGFRWSILGSSGLTLTVLVTSVAMALGMSLAGVFYFKSVEREFADYI